MAGQNCIQCCRSKKKRCAEWLFTSELFSYSLSFPNIPTSLISHPSATSEVIFVFMVGDGIQNVTHRSPRPLNDNEWHYVEAEINVKMARLKVDFYPAAIRKFPGQTFVSMKFSQPLLVGA